MLDQTFFALSNETRRAIVDRLLRGEATVGELADPFAMTLPAVSKHLGVLERAGIVQRERRGRQQVCRLQPERLADAAEWLDRHRAFWTGQLRALGHYLATETPPPEEDR